MDVNAFDRVVQLAKVRALATDVLGTQNAAELWLIEPAIGLEQRRPIDLMRGTDGINLVTHLKRTAPDKAFSINMRWA